MTMPTIPPRTIEQSVADLMHSVALEEVALAHIINAEGEKLQKLAELATSAQELLDFQAGLSNVLEHLIKFQMLLQFKLDKVNEICADPATTVTPPRA